MNKIVEFFPDASFIQVGDHYLPMALTLKEDLKTPLDLFFPFAKGVLRVKGSDRKDYLHRMCTGDINNWANEEGHRALFTNSHGKVSFDVFMLLTEEEVLIVTDPGEELRLKQHLELYSITEDLSIEVCSTEFETIYLFNDEKKFQHPVLEKGWKLFASPKEQMEVYLIPDQEQPVEQLMKSESQAIGLELFDELRPVQYFARSGADFNGDHLPQEASLEHAVHFTKGCYLGQEPISRIAFRGRVTKKLYTLRSAVPLMMGMTPKVDEKEIGIITSGSNFQTDEGYFALGYLKTSWVRKEDRSPIKIGNHEVEIVFPQEGK